MATLAPATRLGEVGLMPEILLTAPVDGWVSHARIIATYWMEDPARNEPGARAMYERSLSKAGRYVAAAGHDQLADLANALGWLTGVPDGAKLVGWLESYRATVAVVEAEPAGLPRGIYLVESRRPGSVD